MPNAKHLELSHHLAHAWSVAGILPTLPFPSSSSSSSSASSTSSPASSLEDEKVLVLVMDGMGESYRSMREDLTGLETESGDYMHDLK